MHQNTRSRYTRPENVLGRYQSNATTLPFTHDIRIYTRSPNWVYCTLPHKKDVTANIYVFPLVTEQYAICSNTVFVLLKMGIMMPETC